MKTAMQELIDLMKTHKKRGWSSMTYDFFFAQVEEIKALEKEKEQIMNAFEFGMSEGLSMENNTLGYDANSEKYFNKHYNQNK